MKSGGAAALEDDIRYAVETSSFEGEFSISIIQHDGVIVRVVWLAAVWTYFPSSIPHGGRVARLGTVLSSTSRWCCSYRRYVVSQTPANDASRQVYAGRTSGTSWVSQSTVEMTSWKALSFITTQHLSSKELTTETEIFGNGHQAIDLLRPYVSGGKDRPLGGAVKDRSELLAQRHGGTSVLPALEAYS